MKDRADTATLEHYGPTQRRLMEALLQAPTGLSVEALAARADVTPSAVRQHLAGLERDGRVGRASRKPTRGRPEQLYTLTDAGREAFPRRYRHLAQAMIEEVGATLGPEKLADLMRRMGTKAGKAAAAGGRASIEATAAAMLGEGYDAQVSTQDPGEIVARNCVFHQLATQFPAVCEFDLALLEAATGAKPEHRECIVRGGHVCRFGFRKASSRA
jgi:predicted ArsR family transcriptional regulator